MGVIKELVELSDYKTELTSDANKGKLIVVDFHAQWCGPCRAIAPALKALADAHDIIVIKVDVDDAEDIARDEEISAMPTFKFYKNGAKVTDFQGASKPKLESTIMQYK